MFISKSFSFSKPGPWLRFGMGHRPAPATLAGARAVLQRLVAACSRRQATGGALEHLATLPLSAQPSLVLVRLGGQKLLLGTTPHGISLLASSPADLPEPAPFSVESSPPRESPQL